MKPSVLILAGGEIGNKFKVLNTHFSTPALLPVNAKALAQYIIDFYYSKGYTSIFLVVNSDSEQIIQKEIGSFLKKTNTKIIGVADSNSVIQTLEKSLSNNFIQEDVIINIITTIPTCEVEINQILIDNEAKINSEWSGYVFNDNGSQIVTKNNQSKISCFAFQGVFSAPKKTIVDALKNVTSNDLIDVTQKMIELNWIPKFIQSSWIDCGHERNYFKARNLLINSRNFNSLYVDNELITKKSTNINKIKAEIFYYENLTKETARFFPVVYQKAFFEKEASYTMTHYNFPNLSEYVLYWESNEVTYQTIFENIDEILGVFFKSKTTFNLSDYINFYLNKTIKRLEEYSSQIKDENIFNLIFNNDEIRINSNHYRNFSSLVQQINQRLEKMYKNGVFCQIHGDLCFNNILVNPIDFSLKLIDPRGSFENGDFSIYGDFAYDFAKLAHSSIFNYDYLISDLYNLELRDNEFLLSFNLRNNHSILQSLTIALIEKYGYCYKDIELIVGLLFLSMTPIHNDSMNRQLAMYLNGIQILNNSLYE